MAVHMDGRLRAPKELTGQTEIDIVEGFHPPRMGDAGLGEALSDVLSRGEPGSPPDRVTVSRRPGGGRRQSGRA